MVLEWRIVLTPLLKDDHELFLAFCLHLKLQNWNTTAIDAITSLKNLRSAISTGNTKYHTWAVCGLGVSMDLTAADRLKMPLPCALSWTTNENIINMYKRYSVYRFYGPWARKWKGYMYQMHATLLQYLLILIPPPFRSRVLIAQQDLIYNKANITAQKHTVWFPSSLCWVHRDRKFGKILTRRAGGAVERKKPSASANFQRISFTLITLKLINS